MIEVVAELGKNFITTEKDQSLEELLDNAKLLILKAKEAGCKVVKFQVHSDDEIHPNSKLISPHFNKDRGEWVKRCTFPLGFWESISYECSNHGLEFLCTPMSRGAAELIDMVGISRWKIGSADITDFVLLDYIRDSGKPVILSTGMSTIQEVERAYQYVSEKVEDITILHCVSQYPCPLEDLNLATIPFLKRRFPKAKIGLSSHCLNIEGSLMAVYLGARLIESHFTLDRSSFGPDHQVSLLPDEMKELIYRINSGEMLKPSDSALGIYTKYIQEEEMKYRSVFKKRLFASYDILKGELIYPDLICAMRADFGLTAEQYPNFIGKESEKDYKQYEEIR